MLSSALTSSDSPDWLTPPEIADPVLGTFGSPELDPCGHPLSLMRARTQYLDADGQDGLILPWTSTGYVWINPPYGRELSRWATRVGPMGRFQGEILILVPARLGASQARQQAEALPRALPPR